MAGLASTQPGPPRLATGSRLRNEIPSVAATMRHICTRDVAPRGGAQANNAGAGGRTSCRSGEISPMTLTGGADPQAGQSLAFGFDRPGNARACSRQRRHPRPAQPAGQPPRRRPAAPLPRPRTSPPRGPRSGASRFERMPADSACMSSPIAWPPVAESGRTSPSVDRLQDRVTAPSRHCGLVARGQIAGSSGGSAVRASSPLPISSAAPGIEPGGLERDGRPGACASSSQCRDEAQETFEIG